MLINGLFDNPVGGTGFTVEPVDPDAPVNNGKPYHEITIGGRNNWLAMWSLENNRLDFSKSFEGRMFVNFGTAQADGFTFTIHNDSRKTEALTTAQNMNQDGQNLGVYGSSSASTVSGVRKYPNIDAVQNSFTVEFDLYTNGKSRYPYAFDVAPGQEMIGELRTPHMAYSFPGNRDKTYQAINKGLLGGISDVNSWFSGRTGRPGRVVHYGLKYLNSDVGNNVQDGTWYEFNFSFDYDSKEFQYFLRNPVTGNQTRVDKVPWNDLSSELNLSTNDSKAYWGFTAANGASEGEVKVVFADVPVELKYDVSNKVFNESGEEITVSKNDENKDVYAKKGDLVYFETKAVLEQIDYTSPYVMYEAELASDQFDWDTLNDFQVKINDVDIGSYTPTVSRDDGRISLKVDKEFKQGDTIEFQFNIRSKNNSSSDTKETFSSNLITINPDNSDLDYMGSDPAYYWLRFIQDPLNVSWSNQEIITELDESVDKSEIDEAGYTLPFFYNGGSAHSTINYELSKEGQPVLEKFLQNDSDPSSNKEEELIIPQSFVDYGKNVFVLKIYEEDFPEGVQILTFNLDVDGSLILKKVPSILSWKNRTIGQIKGILERDEGNDIDLAVLDSREKPEQDWRVAVSFINENSVPPFSNLSLVWQDLSGERKPIPDAESGETLPIMDNENSSSNDKYLNQMHLDYKAGVLLESKDYLPIGEYENMITVEWTLTQGYTPE